MKILKFLVAILAAFSSIARGYYSLTIDNQLVIIANDCYTRIAIGSILPSKEIAASVVAATVTECEDECSRKRNTCEIFSFGISSKGNATCLLGTRVPNADELESNSDYDIYIRQQSSPQCMPDRLYKLGSGARNPTDFKNDENNGQNDTSRGQKPGIRPINTRPQGGIGTVAIPNAEKFPGPGGNAGNHPNNQNHQNGYQVGEIVQNLPPRYPQGTIFDPDNPNGPFNYPDKNHHGFIDNGYGDAEDAGGHRYQGSQNFEGGYHQDADFYHEEPHHGGGEGGGGDGNRNDYYLHSVIESGNRYGINVYETPDTVSCYRKLFAGKRLAEIHIRKAIDCERIEECSRECDSEKGFSCKGFNYRNSAPRPAHPPRGICELTSMPPSQIDVIRDVQHEPRYDYYEKDLGCENKRPSYRPPINSDSGWLNVRPPPSSRPIEIPRPLLPPHDHRPPIETPRPFGHGYHPPKRRYHGGPEPPRRWMPDEESYPDRIPGLSIRPIEDDVRYDYFRPERPRPPMKDRRPDYYLPRPQPPDLGMNEIVPYQPGRRKDTVHMYGGSYGYGTNFIDGYEPPKRVGNAGTYGQKRPYETSDVYGYGGAFGYGDNRPPSNNGHGEYGGSRPRDVCSVRSGAGFKLRRGIVRKSYLTPSLDQCENLCAVERDCLCMTFSYRYSLAASAPTDNCLLSEISYRDLDFYTDLEPDRDYDIYSMVSGDQKSCGIERPESQRPPEECFWRVRSGCGVPPQVVRKTIVAHGLGDCEAECVEARLFTCRSFVYRYREGHSATGHGSPNCYLSDWSSEEIDPLSLPELDGAELYQRGSFGRGCEPTPFPPLNNHMTRPEPDNRPMNKDEVCYAEYKKPCRLTPQSVMFTVRVKSEFECRQRCSEMRERDRFGPCMSFSYRISSDREDHNCFMSDVPRRDLRPGIDYVHGDGYLLFAWKEFDPKCDSGYAIGIFIDHDDRDYRPSPVPSYDSGRYPSHFEPPYEDDHRPQRPHGNRYPPSRPSDLGDHRPAAGHGGYGDNLRPVDNGGYNYPRPQRPVNPDRPDPVGPNYGGGGGGFYDDTDGRFSGYSGGSYNDFSHKHGGSTFQHFTVNGRPCKRGTKCERNKVAGFWSCEPEGGEFGTWDYCCEPKHHCGYSQGYHYPWCYVGPYEDQWRPCSEKYYPNIPSPRPVRPSSHGHYQTDDDRYGEVPRPGMLGRHWPVAYLHREAPPNATVTDSFVAGDTRRNRELQQPNVSLKNNGSSISRGKKMSENYVVRNSQSTPINELRSGTIERIISLSESRNSETIAAAAIRNRNSTGSRREINETFEFADLIDSRDSTAGLRANKTLLDSSDWSGTTFVRLPTISRNKTTSDESKSEYHDYFEVVDVE